MKKRLLLAIVGAIAAVLPIEAAISFYYNYNGQTLKFTVVDPEAKTCKLASYELFGTVPHKLKGDLVIPEVAIRSNRYEYRVVEIGEKSFFANQITSVVIPNSVTKIDSGAFMGTDLESVTIPESISEIPAKAFSDCINLESVNLPESIIHIGDGAFRRCYSLKSIKLPASLTSLGMQAFDECLGLTQIDLPESLTTIGNGAFRQSGLKSIIIPNSVTSLGKSVFFSCHNLESVTLSESITALQSGTFMYCTKLQSVKIPETVTTIDDNVFEECTALTSINIPEAVTSIGKDAFYKCQNLEKIVIPESVSYIGSQAFEKCSKIKTVKLPETLTTLEHSVFCSCSSLTSVTLPKSLTSIGGLAFYNTGLSAVIIPESVKTIGSNAFGKCPNLTSVYYTAQVPLEFVDNIFDDATLSDGSLNVVESAVGQCGQLTPWNQFASIDTFDPVGAAEYKPLLEIGKSWTTGQTVYHGLFIHRNAQMPSYQTIRNYEVVGDTIVENTPCKVVESVYQYDDGKSYRYKYILHEENGVVSVYNENFYKRPFVKVFDFNASPGDDLKVIPIDVMEQVWDYNNTFCTPTTEKFAKGPDGVTRKEIVFNGSSWVEGIGASHDNWLVYTAIHTTSSDQISGNYLIECKKDGKTIFSGKDFTHYCNDGLIGAKTITPGKSWTMARGSEILTFTVDRDTLVRNMPARVVACSDGKEYIVTEYNGKVYGFSDRFGKANPDYNAFPITDIGATGHIVYRVDGSACAYMKNDYWKITDVQTLNVNSRTFNEYIVSENDDTTVASWVEGVGAPDAQSWATQMPEGYDLRMIDCRQDGEVIFTAEDFTHKSGIKEVSVDRAKRSGVYDLQGRRVEAPTRGLYIIDGKKQLIK